MNNGSTKGLNIITQIYSLLKLLKSVKFEIIIKLNSKVFVLYSVSIFTFTLPCSTLQAVKTEKKDGAKMILRKNFIYN